MREPGAARPQVIAHRGASRVQQENTVAAFRTARELGADAVELDVRRSRDGALVVHHDAHLPDGRLIVETDESDLPDSVPGLVEALDACAGMWVNIEIKNHAMEPDHDPDETVARGVMQELARRDEAERWLISSFSMATVDTCRAIDPTVRTAWLCTAPPERAAALMVAKGHAALHPWEGATTEALVTECHAAGVAVNVWTVDDPDRLAELAGWGVDGLCTNVPDLALRVVAPLG